MKKIKIGLFVKSLLFIAVVVAGVAMIAWWRHSPEPEEADIHAAMINEIKPMVRLCSMEIYDEVPMHDSIGTRHIFARELLRGSVTFDVENLQMKVSGDTMRVTLPPEIIEIYESTDPDAYRVIDTWNTRLFGSSNFTTAEENAMKRRMRERWKRHLYENGTVRRARLEAQRNLTDMLSRIFTEHVLIVDDPATLGHLPTPFTDPLTAD